MADATTTATDEVAIDFHTLFRIYKDGRIDRFAGTQILPPTTHPDTGVRSKDVVINPGTGLSARLFLPKITADHSTGKLPFLLFIHGGAFCIETPFSPNYHNHVAALAAEANVVALSLHYRRPPEHLLPAAYDDAWEALNWAIAHSEDGDGPEEWLKHHADFQRIFVAGDSAGANIANTVLVRVGSEGVRNGSRVLGMILFHPYFHNGEPNKLLDVIFPTSSGATDPRLNPAGADPNGLAKLGCESVLIFVAKKDWLKDRGWSYYEALRKSGWVGKVEIVESEDEDHVFHLLNPACEKAVDLMKKTVSFLKQV